MMYLVMVGMGIPLMILNGKDLLDLLLVLPQCFNLLRILSNSLSLLLHLMPLAYL
jgi:hypothetical protein